MNTAENNHDIQVCDKTGLDYIVTDGHRRLLASIPSKGQMQKMFAPYKDSGNPMYDKKDWREVNRRDIFPPSLIYDQNGHGSCFPSGTRIRMEDGSEKPIEEVRLLDKVLTAEGNIGTVTHLFVRENANKLINLKVWGHNHLRMTEEHPVLTKRGYIKAKNLRLGDFVAFPRYLPQTNKSITTADHVKCSRWMVTHDRTVRFAGVVGRAEVLCKVTAVPEVILLTPGVGRIFGMFLAEGNTDTNKISWTFNITEKETLATELIELLKNEWDVEGHYSEKPTNGQCKVTVYGKLWGQLLESLCSTGSGSKKMHKDITSGPKDFLRQVLRGWLDGDGHARRGGDQGTTISKNLALGMYDIAQGLGRRPSIRVSYPKLSPGVRHRHPRWDVEMGKGKTHNYSIRTKKRVWRKIKGIIYESFKGPVFNFEVKGDNSYVAEGIGVHNCVGNGWTGAFSRARKLAGAELLVLSPGWTYSLINGNSDNGAVISEGGPALQEKGTCLFSTVGQNPIYQRQMPQNAAQEALENRLKWVFHCSSWAEVMSAVMANFLPVYGYMVGRRFMVADKLGVAGHDSGPGNHCNFSDGCRLLSDGRWVLDDVNSWNTSFMDQGRCFLDEEHLFGGGDQADVCVIGGFIENPHEPVTPVVYTK